MKYLLFIPCFNETKRLNIQAFKQLESKIDFIFVDDGSKDGTSEFLAKSGFSVFTCPKNLGKGNALQKAIFESSSSEILDKYDWIGFWDADLATPLEAVFEMIKFLELYSQEQVVSIWGSRNSRLGSKIIRQAHRHYLGRCFVTLVSIILGVKAYDSQCGAKLFKSEVVKKAFSEPFISRWIFDIEILLRLKNDLIIEYPLRSWEDIPGSKVKVLKEIFRVFFDILKIRKKYLT